MRMYQREFFFFGSFFLFASEQKEKMNKKIFLTPAFQNKQRKKYCVLKECWGETPVPTVISDFHQTERFQTKDFRFQRKIHWGRNPGTCNGFQVFAATQSFVCTQHARPAKKSGQCCIARPCNKIRICPIHARGLRGEARIRSVSGAYHVDDVLEVGFCGFHHGGGEFHLQIRHLEVRAVYAESGV